MEDFNKNYSTICKLGQQIKRKFCSVYLVEDKVTKERFILKKIVKKTSNHHLVNRLIKEAEFSFQHPQLPKVINLYETNTEVALLIEFKDGIELSVFWKNYKKDNKIEIWKKIIEQLIEPLEYLKKNKIVHCDLKPSNILIELNNDSIIPHLIDFGLAVKTDEKEHRTTLFPLGYAAPELILNKRNCIDHTTDLFSIGIISWQLFCNQLPIIHQNPSIMTNLQITHPLPNHPKLKNEVYTILSKMCYKHNFAIPPNKMNQNNVEKLLIEANKERYQSLPELYNDLINIEFKISFLQKMINRILF